MKQVKNDPAWRIVIVILVYSLLPGSTFQAQPTPPGARVAPAGKIAFSSGRNIYSVNPDGSELSLLTPESGAEFNLQPTWSPDRSQIAFVSKRGGNVDIYVMNADGGSVRRLTSNAGEDSQPAWSPDGTRIAFVRGDDPSFAGMISIKSCEPPDIYVIDADGNGPQARLTTKGDNTDPAWSPDSKSIAFSSNQDGNYEIYKMDADGNNVVRLTFNMSGDADPSWSPDGSTIAYGGGYQIVTDSCGIDGIIQNPQGPPFESVLQGPDIHLIKAEGGDDVQLTSTKNSSDPTWSPDGRQIAFSSHRDGDFDIYLIEIDGPVQKALVKTPLHDWSPSWSSAFIFSDMLAGRVSERDATVHIDR